MCSKSPGYFKTAFAKFLSDFDQESYNIHKAIKSELFSEVAGDILEVGPGTGVNFPFLKNKNIRWTGLEPNPAMRQFLQDAVNEFNIDAKVIEESIEHTLLPADRFDYVISTEVLCSVNDLNKSLQAIKRVLRPNGKFLFLEHVVDKENPVRRIVQKLAPYTPWRYYSDGCRPARDIGKTIQGTGFSSVQFKEYMQVGKGIISAINRPHICGWAIK